MSNNCIFIAIDYTSITFHCIIVSFNEIEPSKDLVVDSVEDGVAVTTYQVYMTVDEVVISMGFVFIAYYAINVSLDVVFTSIKRVVVAWDVVGWSFEDFVEVALDVIRRTVYFILWTFYFIDVSEYLVHITEY